jgi:hypothetical protein
MGAILSPPFFRPHGAHMTAQMQTPEQMADLLLSKHHAAHGQHDKCRAILQTLAASNTDPAIDRKLAATHFWMGETDASRRLMTRAFSRAFAEAERKAGRKRAAR